MLSIVLVLYTSAMLSIVLVLYTSAMLSIVGERERFLSSCSGMVECLASYYCVSLVPRPIERVESIVVIISVTLKSSRVSDANRCCWLMVRCCRGAASRSILCSSLYISI